ncbi:uncharacterized protein LOC134769016 [Penaeus indicus]|uniref:uncharacterized protein LOC134769016 n=1 Tax=Penaeus indicus TaxID=29960 RepID=UPI00300D124E
MSILLEGWREKLEDRGCRISRLKTECMKCHFGEEDEQEVDLEIDLEVLRENDIFTYLGSMVQHDGGVEAEITNMIQSGWRNWRKWSRDLGKHQERKERLDVNEMRMLRWTRGVTIRDRVSNRHFRISTPTPYSREKLVEEHLDMQNLPTEGALGLVWSVTTDSFEFKRNIRDREENGRGTLSMVGS